MLTNPLTFVRNLEIKMKIGWVLSFLLIINIIVTTTSLFTLKSIHTTVTELKKTVNGAISYFKDAWSLTFGNIPAKAGLIWKYGKSLKGKIWSE